MKNKLQEMIAQRMHTMDALKPYVDRFMQTQADLQHLGHVLRMVEDDRPPALDLVEDPSKSKLLHPQPVTPTGTLSAAPSGGEGRGEVAPRPRGCAHLKHTIRAGSLVSRIVDTLREIGGESTIGAISAHIGLPAKKVNDALVQGTRRGTFTRTGRGRFALATTAPSAPAHPSHPSHSSHQTPTYKLPGKRSQVLLEAQRVLSTWPSGREFTREELVAQMSGEVLSSAKSGALADAILRLRKSGQIGLVSAPTPTSPAVYKTA